MKESRIDKKLAKLGFVKKEENKYGVEYERERVDPAYLQKVRINYKKNGPNIIQSYDPELLDQKGIGNTCVGMTEVELRLFSRKMKEFRRKYE